ncbi:dihydrofolate reductase [Candidatus Saccharibacteria bacterium]|nr:dihydrofolate reductase [Candidatus Saccharibacteria bacterium]
MFSIIAAIGQKNELGKNGGLVWHIKDDMKHFKNTTMGHKIVMGRNTWLSLPGKLPGRENIVISESTIDGPDLIINDLEQFAKKHQDTDEEIFIIGGGMIYRQFLPYAKNLYLTEIHATDENADTFFPEFKKSDYQKQILKKGSENDLEYSFVKYSKI